jgi:hypothetical protein
MATRQDVYNFIANARRGLRRGQSSIHALVNRLDEGFWTRVRVNKDQCISSILFAAVLVQHNACSAILNQPQLYCIVAYYNQV